MLCNDDVVLCVANASSECENPTLNTNEEVRRLTEAATKSDETRPGRVAITRRISPKLGDCELVHLQRTAIDVRAAETQHRDYEGALERAGCRIEAIVASPGLPDSVFVEDAAVVFDEIAIVTRPGAESRRAETADVAQVLAPYRTLYRLAAPATLDGGDVLRVGKDVFVGRSQRTNTAGFEQFRDVLKPLGYRVRRVAVQGCLHLKSAITDLDGRRLLANRSYIDETEFAAYELIDVDSREPDAANALRVGTHVIYSAHQPRTRDRIVAAGLDVLEVDASEIAKAEGGVTCCSLIVEETASR